MFAPDRSTEADDDAFRDDGQSSIHFIGRHKEREKIKDSIKHQRCRLLQITGVPMIGKAALAEQIALELVHEAVDCKTDLKCYVLSCKDMYDWHSFVDKLCQTCGITTTAEHPGSVHDLKAHFTKITRENPSSYHLIVLTKCDNLFLREEVLESFYTLCSDLVDKNMMMIITSQKWLFSSPNSKVKIQRVELSEMTLANGNTLLQIAAPDVDFHSEGDTIVRGCHCLPFMILLTGQLLSAHHGCLLPSDMSKILQNVEPATDWFRRPNSSQFKIEDNMIKVILRLPKHSRRTLVSLSVFGGSFLVDAASAVIDSHEHSETKVILSTLVEHSVLTFDSNRFRLFPFLKPFICSEPGMMGLKCMAELRYVKFFGRLLKDISKDMYIKSMDRVCGYLHEDIDNVTDIIKKAIHNPNKNIFKTYMKVVEGTEDLVVTFFPRDAERFYRRLLDMSAILGTDRDRAVLKSHLAFAMTGINAGENTFRAAELYEEAMPILSNDDSDAYQLLLLLQRLIMTYQKMGRNADGKKCIEHAQTLKFENSLQQKAERIKLGISADKTRLDVFHENYETVKADAGRMIEEAQRLAPHHPAIGKLINCIGLMYERSNIDKMEALKNYRLSIFEKKKFERQCPEIMIDSMNNAAMLICKEVQDDVAAMEMLEETLEICLHRLGWEHYDTALTLWNMGQAYMRKFDFPKAQDKIALAKGIFSRTSPEHWANVEVRMTLAHCYMATNRFQDATRTFEEIKTYRGLYAKHMPQGVLVSSAIEHLLYLDNGDNVMNIHRELVEELQRIQNENMKAKKEEKWVENHRKEQQYHYLAAQCLSKHDKSKLYHPGNPAEPILDICSMCKRYKIKYYFHQPAGQSH